MPDKIMDSKKLETYRKQLMALKEEILHDIKKLHSDNGEGAAGASIGHGMHMADVASDMYDREFSLNLASNERELLQKIDEALARIDKAGYGLCQECGKSIPIARLKALPYVENCLKCQEALEQNSR